MTGKSRRALSMRMTTRLFHCGLDTTLTQNGFVTVATVHVFLACVMLLLTSADLSKARRA